MLEKLVSYLEQTQRPNTIDILLKGYRTKNNSFWMMIDSDKTIYIQKTLSQNLEITELKAISLLLQNIDSNTTVNIYTFDNTLPNYLNDTSSKYRHTIKIAKDIVATQESKNITLCYHKMPGRYSSICNQILQPIRAYLSKLLPEILLIGSYDPEQSTIKKLSKKDFLHISQRTPSTKGENLDGKSEQQYSEHVTNTAKKVRKSVPARFAASISDLSSIQIYTDGSTQNKKGVSAWSVVFDETTYYAGIFENRNAVIAEMEAIYQALLIVDNNSSITIYTDCLTQILWLTGNAAAKTKKIQDKINIIKILVQEKQLTVQYRYVQGHSDNKYNNLAHELAYNKAREHCHDCKK